MAIILFRKSTFKIFDEYSFVHELDNGWFLTDEEAEADWASNLPKDDKDVIIKKLRARKAELLAEQNKE
jgi:hypothetical protein